MPPDLPPDPPEAPTVPPSDPAPTPPEPAPAPEPAPPAPTPAPPDPRWRTVRLSVPLVWEFVPAKFRLVLLAAVAFSPLYLDMADRRGVHVPHVGGCTAPTPTPTPTPKPIVIPPDPPKPPPPAPPAPPVPPAPAPKPAGPLRVVMVYESSANMTRKQVNTLNSSVFRSFLNDHCAKDDDGRPGWRCWDKDIDVSNESDTWKSLWAAAKPLVGTLPLPQILVFRGQAGTSYPLPETADDAAKLLADLAAVGGNR